MSDSSIENLVMLAMLVAFLIFMYLLTRRDND